MNLKNVTHLFATVSLTAASVAAAGCSTGPADLEAPAVTTDTVGTKSCYADGSSCPGQCVWIHVPPSCPTCQDGGGYWQCPEWQEGPTDCNPSFCFGT